MDNIQKIIGTLGQKFSQFVSQKAADEEKMRTQAVQTLQSLPGKFVNFMTSAEGQAAHIGNELQRLQLPKIDPTTVNLQPLQQKFNSFVNGVTHPQIDTTALQNKFKNFVQYQANQPVIGPPTTLNPLTLNNAAKVGGYLSKQFLYNPDTKRILPESIWWKSQESAKTTEDFIKGRISKDEFIKQSTDQTLPIVMGLAGGLETVSPEGHLKGLLTYKDTLIKEMGYSEKAAEKISFPEFERILAKTRSKAQGMVGEISDAVDAFKTWVNARRTAPIEGQIAAKPFQILDSQGIEGINKFQAGEKEGVFANVKQYFDNRYKQLQDAGLNFHFKQDYLPQLWSNSEKEIEKKLGKTLTQRPSFSLESVIKDYQQGINAGLTPRFEKISDLVRWYEQRSSKVLADKTFFDFLNKKGFLVPADSAPKGWVTITNEGFPTFKTNVNDVTYEGLYKAPPEVAKLIDNYLTTPDNVISHIANFTTRVKNLGLSGGVPGTSLNYHGGVNLYVRSIIADKNPVAAIFRSAKWIVNPTAADNFMKNNLQDAAFFTRHGLTLSAEDWDLIQRGESNILSKAEGKIEEMFGDSLFKKTLPAMKLNYAKQVYEDLLNSYSKEEAAKIASSISNSTFGGINLDELGRSKETQNLLRSIFLAPDWAETNIKTGAGIVKGIFQPGNPQYKAYRVMARNLLAMYGMNNVINKALSGHWQFENSSGHGLDIDTGTYTGDGKKRYLSVWGTAVDFARIPYQIAEGLAKGDVGAITKPVVNRFSMPVAAGLHLATNQNYLHQPIYGNDKYGNAIPPVQQAGSIANEVMSGVGVPVQIRSVIDYLSGKSNAEQAVVNSLEIPPIKYEGGAYSAKQKEKVNLWQQAGMTGENIYNELKNKILAKSPDQGTTSTDPLLAAINAKAQTDDKLARIREIFKTHSKPEEVQQLLKAENLGSYEDASTYMIKQLDTNERAALLKTMLKGMDTKTYQGTMLYLLKNKILTAAVLQKWYEDGEVSLPVAIKLKALINKANASTAIKAPAKPKKLSLPSFKQPAAISIKPYIPTAPKFSPPTLKRLVTKPLKVKSLKISNNKFHIL